MPTSVSVSSNSTIAGLSAFSQPRFNSDSSQPILAATPTKTSQPSVQAAPPVLVPVNSVRASSVNNLNLYGASGRLNAAVGAEKPASAQVQDDSQVSDVAVSEEGSEAPDSPSSSETIVIGNEQGTRGADEQVRSDRSGESRRSNDNDEQARQQERVEAQQVAQLAARDREVKAHERAHQAIGGQYAGSVSYSYQTGPDGKRYAVSGEVPIDVSPVPGDPRATIEKMRVVKAAATAPANPSPQDRSVAATATRILVDAQIELSSQRSQEREEVSTDEGRERFSEAARTYEEIIGLDREQVNPRELIDELV